MNDEKTEEPSNLEMATHEHKKCNSKKKPETMKKMNQTLNQILEHLESIDSTLIKMNQNQEKMLRFMEYIQECLKKEENT